MKGSDDITDLCRVLRSMSRRGQGWDSAPMESFFSTIKQETGSP